MEIKQTNFAIIGLGGRGQGNLGELISIDGVKVVAVCDKYEDRARRGVEIVKEKTGEEPEMYLDYKELLKRDDIKAVMVATTWITHVRIAVDESRQACRHGSRRSSVYRGMLAARQGFRRDRQVLHAS